MSNAWAGAEAAGARRLSQPMWSMTASLLARRKRPPGTAAERGGIAALNPRFRRLAGAQTALLCRTLQGGRTPRLADNFTCVDKFRSAAIWHFNCLERYGRWWPGTSVRIN